MYPVCHQACPRLYLLRYIVFAVLSLSAAAGSAAEDNNAVFECPQNAAGITSEIKAILGPGFADEKAQSLDDSFRRLEILSLQAGHCSAMARSTKSNTDGRDQNIMEWHSINQWLVRLVSVVSLNRKGHLASRWQDEYQLFAEVYEFEP